MDARPFDLVLFDLDGTLVETAPEIADAVNDTLTALGHAPVAQQQVDDWIGHGTRELLIKALAQAVDIPPAEVRASDAFGPIEAEFGRHYQARCGTRSHLYPQVRESLEAFLAQGGRKIDAWYAALEVVEVSFDDEADAFRNINTLEELRRE